MKKVLAILTLGLFAAGAYAQAPAVAPGSKEPAKVEKTTHKSKTHATKHTKKAADKPAAQ